MRYKIGQLVRILPEAKGIGVAGFEIGKIRKVVAIIGDELLDIQAHEGRKYPWRVWIDHIEPYNEAGKQLLLWNDL